MHVKEDLIFNKHSGELIGFSNLGDINNNLEVYLRSLDTDIEQSPSLAKSVMHGIYGCERTVPVLLSGGRQTVCTILECSFPD